MVQLAFKITPAEFDLAFSVNTVLVCFHQIHVYIWASHKHISRRFTSPTHALVIIYSCFYSSVES